MERGFYKNAGDEFYRYLDAKLLIKEPVEFNDDGFAIVDAAIASDDFKLPVFDVDPGFSVMPEPIEINNIDPGFNVVPEPIATRDIDPGFSVVPEPVKKDLFQKFVIDRKGNFRGQDPLHKGNVVKVEEGIIYYDNGVLKPFMPTGEMVWAVKENVIHAEMKKFIVRIIDKIELDELKEKDIENLKQYFDHASTEQFVYDSIKEYFEELEQQGVSKASLQKTMEKLQIKFEELKKQNQEEVESKIAMYCSPEREPGEE